MDLPHNEIIFKGHTIVIQYMYVCTCARVQVFVGFSQLEIVILIFTHLIFAYVFIITCTTLDLPRRDSVPYAALYIAPILIDTRLHSTRGQFFIRHECGAMYTSQNEHFAYTYDIAVCIWIQYIRHHLSAYFR